MPLPKTPRRSLRSYLRTAPLVVIPFRDTEILADLECHRPSVVPPPPYKLGKPAAPRWWVRAADKALAWILNVLFSILVAAAAIVGLLAIFPPPRVL